ncbi:prephenate dehydratase [Williamsia sterculiae]|uniref:Prephenate dehydratase n=1 Tax=Williamsia sterculiae TaxID=1344003 RepID=A0A1N7H8X5_9NOCA|nr:prephenate dehydratase [Williamsia sterculiae]SIS21335.1 prephenate dehydratase [Williamsia sterculiae]
MTAQSVAFFGPSGTFTEMALDRVLGDRLPAQSGPVIAVDAEKITTGSPEKALSLVRSGDADYACVPMESSVEGSVPSTMDALPVGPRLQIYAECVLDIVFTVAAASSIPVESVRTIAAYPVAARQVRRSVEELFPDATFVPADSNAAAAQDVADGRADAAVTTALAAEISGLTALADGVADAADAATRFVLVGRPGPVPRRTGADRTSVILDLPNQPGSLVRAMLQFADRGIDLTRIESRPAAQAGEYYFYLDAVGHIDDAAVAEALAALHRQARDVTYLGSWPAERPGGSPPPDHRPELDWLDALRRGGE